MVHRPGPQRYYRAHRPRQRGEPAHRRHPGDDHQHLARRFTVALIVGDPGHEGLQLDEVSLAAAATMIEALGAATHGRWDAGRRSTVWCFDVERARAADLKEELQTIRGRQA